MRRFSRFLCLIAALVGTPLRLAEAAADLERLAGGVVSQGELGEVDGGVGDEPEVGVQGQDGAALHADPLEAGGVVLLPPPASVVLNPMEVGCLRERVWWPEDPPARRFAWFQVFRF